MSSRRGAYLIKLRDDLAVIGDEKSFSTHGTPKKALKLSRRSSVTKERNLLFKKPVIILHLKLQQLKF
jgi:hypothetical protein